MDGRDGGERVLFHYLPYRKEDEKLGMICTTAGSQDTAPGIVYPPHKEKRPAALTLITEMLSRSRRQDISVKEAAWRMGFDDQYYFSRLFKSKTGIAQGQRI